MHQKHMSKAEFNVLRLLGPYIFLFCPFFACTCKHQPACFWLVVVHGLKVTSTSSMVVIFSIQSQIFHGTDRMPCPSVSQTDQAWTCHSSLFQSHSFLRPNVDTEANRKLVLVSGFKMPLKVFVLVTNALSLQLPLATISPKICCQHKM